MSRKGVKWLLIGLVVVLCLMWGVAVQMGGSLLRQKAQKMSARNELMTLGLLYHKYWVVNKKWPATVEELATVTQANDSIEARVIDNLRSSKYVLYLDVDIAKLPAGSANTVLGYEAKAPAEGGQVLMADGVVKDMTAAEFQAASKPPNAKPSKP